MTVPPMASGTRVYSALNLSPLDSQSLYTIARGAATHSNLVVHAGTGQQYNGRCMLSVGGTWVISGWQRPLLPTPGAMNVHG